MLTCADLPKFDPFTLRKTLPSSIGRHTLRLKRELSSIAAEEGTDDGDEAFVHRQGLWIPASAGMTMAGFL
jgi:hypothetical protein